MELLSVRDQCAMVHISDGIRRPNGLALHKVDVCLEQKQLSMSSSVPVRGSPLTVPWARFICNCSLHACCQEALRFPVAGEYCPRM